jgi:Domain of unknown function (DUF1877)
MGMVLILRAVDEKEARTVAGDPDDWNDFLIDEDDDADEVDFDKAWHALHFCLVGCADPIAHPLSLFGCGESIGHDLGYESAILWVPEHVRAFRDELAKLTDQELRERYDPVEMAKQNVYLAETLADEPINESWEYVAQGLPALRKFADRSVENGRAVISRLS